MVYYPTNRVTGLDYDLYDNRTITLNKAFDKKLVQQGDVVEVTIVYNKPKDSSLQIHDTIPAGFEYSGTERGSVNYSVYHQNQDIDISVHSYNNATGTVRYYMKAVQKGIYHVDPAAGQNYFEEWLFMTKPMKIEVE